MGNRTRRLRSVRRACTRERPRYVTDDLEHALPIDETRNLCSETIPRRRGRLCSDYDSRDRRKVDAPSNGLERSDYMVHTVKREEEGRPGSSLSALGKWRHARSWRSCVVRTMIPYYRPPQAPP